MFNPRTQGLILGCLVAPATLTAGVTIAVVAAKTFVNVLNFQ